MQTAQAVSAKDEILRSLSAGATGIDGLVADVVKRNPTFRPVEMKILALDLVTQGILALNDRWEFNLPN